MPAGGDRRNARQGALYPEEERRCDRWPRPAAPHDALHKARTGEEWVALQACAPHAHCTPGTTPHEGRALARAAPQPDVPQRRGGAAGAVAPAGTTLRDLCPDDKAKVARLIKQVVELEAENKRLRAASKLDARRSGPGRPADADGDGSSGADGSDDEGDGAGGRGDVEERLRQLQETNRQVITHNIA